MKRLVPLLLSYLLFCTAGLVGQDAASISGSGANASGSTASGGSGAVGMVVGSNYVLKPSDVIQIEVYHIHSRLGSGSIVYGRDCLVWGS